MRSETDGGPPPPPPFRAKVVLTRKQLFGLPVLFAIPLIALAGLLGESTGHVVASSSQLELRVDFPSRGHYREIQGLHVMVRNRTTRPIDTITVRFDASYMNAFSQVRFEPSPTRAYDILLTSVGPGYTRLVAVELSGDRYGRHRGEVSVSGGTDTVRAGFNTFVFP